jgi:hypothetical protein
MPKADMPLVLQPELLSKSRDEIESHLEEIRARRMVAAIEYNAGKEAKLAHESDKLQRKVKGECEMLGKEIMALDRALWKVEQRLIRVEGLRQELGVIGDMQDGEA